MHYNCVMKTAQLPPVRVMPLVREQIESVLQQGETLSQFVEHAAIETAQRRKQQMEFVMRGRASLARALKTGESYAAKDVLDAMQARLDARVAARRRVKA
jgi:hypothetical protein